MTSEEYSLPLTHAERAGKKPVQLVRAAVRIAVVMAWPDGWKCLFVRHQTKGLELPGGAIDPGEDPQRAALRELREEAGVRLPADHPLTLIAMTPIQDGRGASWLDIMYGTEATRRQGRSQQEPELPIIWLMAQEIEKQVNPYRSSYSAALKAFVLLKKRGC